MLKKLLITLIIVVNLHAAKSEKYQIIANKVNSKDNIVIATGDVIIFSPTYYITAQKVIYDKNKETFELFDDVVVLKDNSVQTKSNYAFLEVQTKNSYQKPNLFYDDSSAIWMSSLESKRKNDTVNLKSSVLSSCDCIDPDWSIRSSSVDYDTKDKWVNAYNARLYFKDLPVMYTPYIGFSTDRTRRTGLLTPTIGYSSSKGAYYSQSLFIAPVKNYDIELTPQLYSTRGSGLYAYFRYADSPDSMLKIRTGYFKEKDDYFQEESLRNKEHYGLDVNYERYNTFVNGSKFKDGLFVDINYLNDIEYYNLSNDASDDDDDERYVESKINYILDSSNYFIGTYFRYYIDTEQDSNENTLQELPKLQLHKYSKTLFDKLMYSTDFKYTNHYKETGINVNQYDLSVPISYSFSFFNDYLKLILKQETSFLRYDYSGENSSVFENGTYGETNTIISLNSDLIKPYEDYLHTINLAVDYTKSKNLKEDGSLYGVNTTNSLLSAFPVSETSDNIKISLNESLYNRENLRQIINHKLSQSIIYDELDDPKLQNLENEITYNYLIGTYDEKDISGKIYNKLVYNQQDEDFTESSSSFTFNYSDYYLSLGHYRSVDTPNSGKDDLESYNLTARYKFSNKYSIEYYTNYNIKENLRSKQKLSFIIDDRCWNLNISYEKDVEASSSVDNKPDVDNIIFFQLTLKPIGSFIQKYTVSEK